METIQEINSRLFKARQKQSGIGQANKAETERALQENQAEIENLEREKKRIQREAVESDPAYLSAQKALADFNGREGTLINRRRNLEKERTRLHTQRGKDFLFNRPVKKITVEIEKVEYELAILNEGFAVWEDIKRELNNNIAGAKAQAERRVYRE